MAYVKPFAGNFRITSPYGPRNGKLHDGIDFGTPKGTPIYAIGNGKVVVSKLDQYGGNWVDVQLDNGMLVRYLHFSQNLVKVGQVVKAGDLLGRSGGVPGEYGSGLSTGAHLHMAIRKNGSFYNWYSELWPNMREPTGARAQPASSGPTPAISNPTQQEDDMLKQRLLDAINNGPFLAENDKSALRNAVNNGDMNYVMAFGGTEMRRWLADKENQIRNLEAEINSLKNHALNIVLTQNTGLPGDTWKDTNLQGEFVDLHQAVSRNDLTYIVREVMKGRELLKSSPSSGQVRQLQEEKDQLADQTSQLQDENEDLKRALMSQPSQQQYATLQNQVIQQQKALNDLTATNTSLRAKLEKATEVNSSTKPFWTSKKWLSQFLSLVGSTGVLIFQSAQIKPEDDWQTILTKLGSAVFTILGISVVSSNYISGQSKVDEAAVAENVS